MTAKNYPGVSGARAKAETTTTSTPSSIESLFADQAAHRLRALDLFCGAGGATRGLQLAGLHVTAVDNVPQPRNPAERFELGFKAMGIPLNAMTVAEISDAIPPAFSEFVARQWLVGRNQFAARQDGENAPARLAGT